MHLATDYIHPYKGDASVHSRCRIRLYLPYEATDAAVVICSELPDNPGRSVTEVAEQIAAEVLAHFKLPAPPVWIEHHPPKLTNGEEETFDLVTFIHYDVQKVLRGRTWSKEIGLPTRKPLDRQTVETLVGQRV